MLTTHRFLIIITNGLEITDSYFICMVGILCNRPSCNSLSNSELRDHIGSLKSAMVGEFIPWKLVDITNEASTPSPQS